MNLLLIVAVAGLFAWICLRDLRLGLYVFAAALPSYLIRLDFFGVPSTLLEVLFVVLAVTWFIARRRHTVPLLDPTRGLKPWIPGILLLLSAATVSVFVAPNLLAAAGIWKAYYLEPVIVFLIARSLLRDQTDLGHLIDALGVGALFVAAFGVSQWLFNIGIPAPWDVERRITSIFPYPNAVALYLGPIIVLGWHRWKSRLWQIALPLSLLAIFFAQSEAAWIALAATGVLAGLLFKSSRRWTLGVMAVALVAIAILPAARAVVVQKLTLHDYSGEVRRSQWQETTNFLHDHPVFGAGLSGYPTALIPYHTHPEYEIFQYPHDILLNIWVELGLLGLIAFASLAFLIARAVWPILHHSMTQPLGHSTTLALASFFALIEMSIHGLVDVPYFKNDLAMLTWLILAIFSLALYAHSTDKKSS